MKDIKVLGPGCAKCAKLKEHVDQAVAKSGVEAQVTKVTDINDMVSYGVMMTPALVVDGEVKFSGKVASVDEIAAMLS